VRATCDKHSAAIFWLTSITSSAAKQSSAACGRPRGFSVFRGDSPPGVYSIAKFELVEHGSGSKIVFDHTGFPKGAAEGLASGWKAHYWEPLAKVLA